MTKFKSKAFFSVAVFAFILFFNTEVNAQLNVPQGSQKATVTQTVGISEIGITYRRPAVKGREIWGKLVPYGMNNLGFGTAKTSPWRAGANENTTISFTDDVKIEGQVLKAGTYGLFMVIYENGNADILFSSDINAWGSFFYKPENDVLKVTVKTKETTHRELLTFEFVDVKPNETTLSLIWEKKEIPFKIEFDVNNIVMNDIKEKFNGQAGFNRLNWEQAANFANNNGDSEQALKWIDAARNGQFFSKKTYANAQIKAGILNKLGKQKEALELMNESLDDGGIFQVHSYGRQLIALGLKEEALKVFEFNATKFKNTWPVNYGLGRAYSAKGDYKKAIKYLTKALDLAPQKASKDRVQANIDKLKKGEDIN